MKVNGVAWHLRGAMSAKVREHNTLRSVPGRANVKIVCRNTGTGTGNPVVSGSDQKTSAATETLEESTPVETFSGKLPAAQTDAPAEKAAHAAKEKA